MTSNTPHKKSNAYLIGIDYKLQKQEWSTEESLAELKELAETCKLTVVGKMIQKREKPDIKYYLGKGKIDEIETAIEELDVEILISDDELKPSQIRNLEKRLKIKIMDRTGVVLDIFAHRAKTFEAKLQVELAQLDYLLPRLTRMWTHLSRLGGGIGTKGPGETQLEVDKRLINTRVKVIKNELKKVRQTRQQMKQKRRQTHSLSAAIVGYTNAGKSTLMNQLSKANVFTENKVFATLDPTTRKIRLPNKEELFISDTVGFIQKLPHQLVDAFMATLEEVTEADFLIHMIDSSSSKYKEMINTSIELFKELGINHKKQVLVFNKTDRLTKDEIKNIEKDYPNAICLSILKKQGLPKLINGIEKILDLYRKVMTFHVPFNRMDLITMLREKGHIIAESYEEEAIITVEINSIVGNQIAGQLRDSK